MDLAMQGCCPGVTLVTCHFVIGFSRLQTSAPYYPPSLVGQGTNLPTQLRELWNPGAQ